MPDWNKKQKLLTRKDSVVDWTRFCLHTDELQTDRHGYSSVAKFVCWGIMTYAHTLANTMEIDFKWLKSGVVRIRVGGAMSHKFI